MRKLITTFVIFSSLVTTSLYKIATWFRVCIRGKKVKYISYDIKQSEFRVTMSSDLQELEN